jgi:predicted HTH domain antitoxin
MRILVDVPEEYVDGQSPAQVAYKLKLYTALLMFKAGEVSAGGATEFAGIDRFTLAAECTRLGISLVDYPPTDLHDEVASLRRLS